MFPGIVRILGKQAPAFFQAAAKNKVVKPYLQSLDEYASLKPEYFASRKDLFDEANNRGLKKSVQYLHSQKRLEQINTDLDEHLNTLRPGEDPGTNTFEFFNSKINVVTGAYEEQHRRNVGHLGNMLRKAGPEVHKLFTVALEFPHKLKTSYNIDDKTLFTAISAPDMFPTDSALHKLGKVFRKWDSEVRKSFQDVGMFGDIDDFTISMRPNVEKIKSLGVEGFADLLTRTTVNMDSDAALKFSREFFSMINRPGRGYTDVTESLRFLDFGVGQQRIDNMFDFLSTASKFSTEETLNLLPRMLAHKENLMRKVHFFNEFGESPEQTLKTSFTNLKKGMDGDTVKQLTDYENKLTKIMEMGLGKNYTEYGVARLYAEATHKYISGTYGAASSLVRNALTDFTGHAAAFLKGLMTDESWPHFIHNRLTRPFGLLAKNIVTLGSDNPLSNQLRDYIDVLGFATTNNALFKGQGMRGINFIYESGEFLEAGTRSERVGKALNYGAGRYSEMMNTVSGNAMHYDTLSAVNLHNTAFTFSNLVAKHVKHKDFLKTYGRRGTTFLKYVFGIGEREYGALVDVFNTVSKEIDAPQIKKMLGFKGGKMLLPDDILKMSDSIAAKYRGIGETTEQFKQRLRISYFSMLNEERNLAQTSLNRANKFVDRGLQRGTMIDFYLRPFTPFFNITHAQYMNLRRGISLAMYESPFNTDLTSTMMSKQGANRWIWAMGYYGSMGIGTVWAKDVLYGRTPREMNAEQFTMAIAGSGLAGIPGSIIQSIGFKTLGKNYYSTTPIGSTIYSLQQALTNYDDPYRLMRAAQDTTGFGRIWYAKGMVDHFMRQAFLSPMAIREMDDWYKQKLGTQFLFD